MFPVDHSGRAVYDTKCPPNSNTGFESQPGNEWLSTFLSLCCSIAALWRADPPSKESYRLKSTIFCDITPCSPLKVNRRFVGRYRLHFQDRISLARYHRDRFSTYFFTLVSSLAYTTLKMEAIYFSETSVNCQRTTQRYIPAYRTLHNHCCANLKSYTVLAIVCKIHIFRSTKGADKSLAL
jgi:hypothetical protein